MLLLKDSFIEKYVFCSILQVLESYYELQIFLIQVLKNAYIFTSYNKYYLFLYWITYLMNVALRERKGFNVNDSLMLSNIDRYLLLLYYKIDLNFEFLIIDVSTCFVFSFFVGIYRVFNISEYLILITCCVYTKND